MAAGIDDRKHSIIRLMLMLQNMTLFNIYIGSLTFPVSRSNLIAPFCYNYKNKGDNQFHMYEHKTIQKTEAIMQASHSNFQQLC